MEWLFGGGGEDLCLQFLVFAGDSGGRVKASAGLAADELHDVQGFAGALGRALNHKP